MTVMNDVIHDGRVMKEARTLNQADYTVTVVGLGKERKDYEVDGIRIILAKESGVWGRVLSRRRSLKSISGENSQKDKATNSFKQKLYMYIKGISLLLISLSGERRILREIKRKKINVERIHCHDLNTLFVGVTLKRKKRAYKLVYDSHELWTEMSGINFIVKKYYQKKEKKYIKYANTVITVSPSIAKILQTRYDLPVQPTLVRNLPEYSASVQMEKNSRIDHIIKIIYVGFYLRGRGIEYVIQQIPQVDPCYKFYFRMEGNPEDINNLKKQVIQLGIEDRVKILPFVPQEELVAEISNYDIGLLPYINVSLNNKFCLPNKLFQYIEAGTAILANDLPDVASLLKENECGLCYDMDSRRSLSYVLNHEMKDQVKKFKVNTGTASKETLNWDSEKNKLLEVWNSK